MENKGINNQNTEKQVIVTQPSEKQVAVTHPTENQTTGNQITKKHVVDKNKNVLFTILAVLIMIGVGISYYFYWEEVHYFETDNAKVTSDLYSITSGFQGQLVRFSVSQGSIVKANQVIGRIQNGPYIKSPIDGEVIKTYVTLNQILSPSTVVAIIADTNDTYVGANIEETDIIKIKEGQSVIVQLDAYPEEKFNGHVSEIDQTTQTAITGNSMSYSTGGTYTKVTQLIPIKITIDEDVNLDGLIGTNSTIKIRIK